MMSNVPRKRRELNVGIIIPKIPRKRIVKKGRIWCIDETAAKFHPEGSMGSRAHSIRRWKSPYGPWKQSAKRAWCGPNKEISTNKETNRNLFAVRLCHTDRVEIFAATAASLLSWNVQSSCLNSAYLPILDRGKKLQNWFLLSSHCSIISVPVSASRHLAVCSISSSRIAASF